MRGVRIGVGVGRVGGGGGGQSGFCEQNDVYFQHTEHSSEWNFAL